MLGSQAKKACKLSTPQIMQLHKCVFFFFSLTFLPAKLTKHCNIVPVPEATSIGARTLVVCPQRDDVSLFLHFPLYLVDGGFFDCIAGSSTSSTKTSFVLVCFGGSRYIVPGVRPSEF